MECSIKGCKQKGIRYFRTDGREYCLCAKHKFLLFVPLREWVRQDGSAWWKH